MSSLRRRVAHASPAHAAVALPTSLERAPPSAAATRAKPRAAAPASSRAAAAAARVLLLLLTLCACVTRLYRIHYPPVVVFDEFHFFRFLRHQLAQQFVFDIHPWLGKLTHLFLARVLRFQPNEQFEPAIGAPYYNRDYVANRVLSALFGAACIPLMFAVAREMQLSLPSATLAAWLPLCDNLLLMQSRYVLLDSQLIMYLNLTLWSALRLWRYARREYGSWRYYASLAATATSGALALSVKWTAAVTPFLVALVCAFGGGALLPRPLPLLDAALAATIALGVYVLPWWLYVRVSVFSTPSAKHMSDAFRHSLRGNASFPFRAQHNVSVWSAVRELHVRQFRANANVRTRHAWESRWYEWPLNARGLLFYINKAEHFSAQRPFVHTLYAIQNPAGALWVSAAVASALLLLLLLQRYGALMAPPKRVAHAAAAARLLCAGYVLNVLPYMFVQRCYFLYHYLPALSYGQLLLALLVELLPTRARYAALVVVMGSTLGAFVHWSPWVYGTPTTIAQYRQLQWMPRWT